MNNFVGDDVLGKWGMGHRSAERKVKGHTLKKCIVASVARSL